MRRSRTPAFLRKIIFPACSCAAILLSGVLPVQRLLSDEPGTWRTGAELQRMLGAPTGIAWLGSPLRPAMARLASDTRCAIFLDRRIDPGQVIKAEFTDTPLRDIHALLALQLRLATTQINTVTYFGPESTVARISRMRELHREQARQLPAASRNRLLKQTSTEWPTLSEPQRLIDQLAADYEVKIVGLERVPHDLWPAVSLPPLSLLDRLTVLLAGFDQTFEIAGDGSTIRIIPLPDESTYAKTYPIGATARSKAAQLGRSYPEAKIRVEGRNLVVEADYVTHSAIDRLLRGQQVTRRTVTTGEERYTISVDNNAVGPVIDLIVKRAGLALDADEAARAMFRRRVTFKVNEVTLKQLLTEALTPAGLTFELDGKKLSIRSGD